MLRWGLVPFWAKDASIGNRMINARAETIAEKPSFRAAYRERRCLVLADGYYEWHTESGTKIPWFISEAHGNAFAFAALWENWHDKEKDETLRSTTIVTTQASSFLQQLHHRMPVVLQPENAARWLAGDMTLLDEMTNTSPKMRAWPVSREVNNARNDGAHLIVADGETMLEG
jgi:putative SOS response-associated peptidase YedK